MTIFNSSTLSSATFMVLLVWMFGLTSGVANACLLEAREGHHHGSPEANEISIGTVEAITTHRDGSDTSRAPCLKFCDDSSNSLVKQQATVDLTDPAHAPFIVGAWPVVTTAVFPFVREAVRWRPPSGPPIRVRFSRLLL
ncbi:MAG: hypothetical protein ABIR26_05180 [Ramlibacter sp.]